MALYSGRVSKQTHRVKAPLFNRHEAKASVCSEGCVIMASTGKAESEEGHGGSTAQKASMLDARTQQP